MENSNHEERPIFPTSYFPSIAYMSALARHSEILVEHHETFPKQTLRNRMVIPTANGAQTLSVPVVRPMGTHTPTSQIEISYAERWNIIHWRTIVTAYTASPYFLYYGDGIETILTKRYKYLTELNDAIMAYLIKSLHIECTIKATTTYRRPEETKQDYRDAFSYKHPDTTIQYPHYTQVFSDRQPFNSNVSVLDLLFNLGPQSKDYLRRIIA